MWDVQYSMLRLNGPLPVVQTGTDGNLDVKRKQATFQ